MLFNQNSILLAALTLGFVIPWSEPSCDCDPHYEDDPCRYDTDCYGGKVCDKDRWECVDPPHECTSNDDCYDGKVCEDWKCVDPPCKCHDDCYGDQICEDYVCVDPPKPCKGDYECPDDHVCKYGECEKVCDRHIDPACD